jgi:putative DNA primase/helicase
MVKRGLKKKHSPPTLADTVLRNDPAWKGLIWYNAYRKLVYLDSKQVDDADYQRISTWLDKTYRVRVAPLTLAPIVAAIAQDNLRNPLQDYLNDLTWDGQPRLSRWLTAAFGVEESRVHELIGRRWLVQAVARALRPGCKADVVLVLAGKQGIRKSSALRELAGVEFFSDSPIPIGEGPRAMSQVYSAWVHELSELASLRGKAVEDVKSFITKTHDDFQPLYARSQVHWARFSVFAGTTNEDTFLGDPTGARRFWPVKALQVDIDWIRSNRDQLWAEAAHAFREGEVWWLDAAEEEMISGEREQYQREETWETLVAGWIATRTPDQLDNRYLRTALTAARVLREALDIDANQHTTGNITRVGQVMSRLGYAKSRPTLDGTRTWVYSKSKAE